MKYASYWHDTATAFAGGAAGPDNAQRHGKDLAGKLHPLAWRTLFTGSQPTLRELRRKVRAPVWNGQDLQGKTIMVRAEQGFGDTIQFLRYASKLEALGATALESGARLPERVESRPQCRRRRFADERHRCSRGGFSRRRRKRTA